LIGADNYDGLIGGLGDLVTRVGDKAIYCTSAPRVGRRLAGPIVNLFRRQYPSAEFVNARSLYSKQGDWQCRWPRERERYGAGILFTCCEDRVAGSDRFADLAGEHAIGIFAAEEVDYLLHAGCPVAWYAVEFPDTYWIARFAIETFELMSSARYARLVPDADADIFCPKGTLFPWLAEGASSDAALGSTARSWFF